MPSKHLDFEFGRVHYTSNERTDLPPLLMLHGNASSAESFEALAAQLDNRFHVIALDFPGHGRSEHLRIPEAAYYYSMEGLRTMLVEVIERLRLQGCILAANSLGANIAAQALPDLTGLRGLVLMASIHSAGKEDFFSNVRPEAPSKTSLKKELDEADVQVLTQAFIHPSKTGLAYDQMAHDIRQADGNFREQIVKFMALQAWPDEIRLLHDSRVPMLYIGGVKDVFIQPAYFERLVERVPQLKGRMELLDGVSHVPHLEDPQRCAQLLQDFAASLA